MYSQELQERFWEKVSIKESNDCWKWKNYLDKDGYGTFYFNRSSMKAHRFSFALFNTEVMDGLEVCHKCDHPWCVNPDHLYIDTHEVNMNDMKRKGRSRIARGSYNENTDLTEVEVIEILDGALCSFFTNKKEVINYNNKFTKNSLNKILNKKTWLHITDKYSDDEFEHIRDSLNNRTTRTMVYFIKKDLKIMSMGLISQKYNISKEVIRKIKQRKYKYS